MEPTPYPSTPIGSPKPKNYLVENIVSAVVGVFCCCGISTVTGIIGIVFATQADSKYTAGDATGAASAANTAKTMFYVTAGLAVVGLIANLIYFFFFGWAFFGNLLQNNGLNFPR